LGYVLASRDFSKAANLLVLIGGVNANEAEPWKGWRQTYYARAHNLGLGVIVCNPNFGGYQNQHATHVKAVLEELVWPSQARGIYFAAHSAGGSSLLEAIAEVSDIHLTRIAKIAFLDSAHRLPVVDEHAWACSVCTTVNKLRNRKCEVCDQPKPSGDSGIGSRRCRNLLQRTACNWISQDFLNSHCGEIGAPRLVATFGVGERVDVDGLFDRFGCRCRGTGKAGHGAVPHVAEDDTFAFFGLKVMEASDKAGEKHLARKGVSVATEAEADSGSWWFLTCGTCLHR
jgi:hypothetical protein